MVLRFQSIFGESEDSVCKFGLPCSHYGLIYGCNCVAGVMGGIMSSLCEYLVRGECGAIVGV